MTMTTATRSADAEKSTAALNSVGAALALTLMKAIVGILTGSLGILAEAAHSGLDLAAAIMTYAAVRISGRPPDLDHPYGHGKVENLSALGETILLLVTCGWIVYEAFRRLVFHRVDVEVTVWSFVVMITSIVVDISRSRMLRRVANKHNSQALEADALHFSTDIWSSAVVVLGLIAVVLSERFPVLSFLKEGDAIAAIAVAVIVTWVSLELGGRTVHALLDGAPRGLDARVRQTIEALPGIADCHQVRMRYSGAQLFVDVHVLIDGNRTLWEVHALTDEAERVVQALVPRADVTVHPEPVDPGARLDAPPGQSDSGA
jgi:cation diffusion facilitator family transporter